MKTLIKSGLLMAVAAVMLFTTSCSKEEEENDNQPMVEMKSIAQIASEDNRFSILVEALTKADLVTTMSNPGDYTVFAPTNDAFIQLLADLGLNSLDDLTKEQLTPILLYHVLGVQQKSSSIETGYASTLSTASPDEDNLTLYISIMDGVKINGSSNVIIADIEASNGVIHAIDKVLLPPTVVDIAIADPNFSILVQAVVKAELVEALSSGGPFTVFAPTNQAFENLFTALNVSGIDALTKEQLTPILLYHVVNGNVTSSEVSAMNVPTLNTEADIAITVMDGKVMLNGSSTVVAVDVQGANGVIHAIDTVILP